MTTAHHDDRRVEPRVDDVLDNPEWFALGREHAHLAEVHGAARRYQGDVTIFGGVAPTPSGDGPGDEAWRDLAALVGPGGQVVIKSIRPDPPDPPAGWTTVLALGGHQLLLRDLDRLRAEADRVAVPADLVTRDLEPTDVPAMLALVARTSPGPFLDRTIEMGRYRGMFAGDDLVAMAGERVHPPGHTELSAVCTAPERRGLGLATVLVREVCEGIVERGESPYLNVAEGNDNARALYERIGFRLRRTLAFRSVRWR